MQKKTNSLSKRAYAESVMPEFKKLGKHITNLEIQGNQKRMSLVVGFREKGKIDMVKKIKKVAENYSRLKYIMTSSTSLRPSKSGYYWYVMIFRIQSKGVK